MGLILKKYSRKMVKNILGGKLLLIVLALFFALNVDAKMYGLFYGCDGNNDLSCPENDVTDLATLYRKNGGQVILVIGDGVTRNNVINGLKKQANACTPNDILIFVYSGHGNDGYIACGNSHVNFSEIKSIMSASKAKRKVVILDACYSGSFADQKHGKLSGENVIVITSSRRNEESGEVRGSRNSCFFEAMFDAFSGKADGNDDGKITAKEMYDYTHPIFEGSRFMQQHPTMKGRFNDNTILYTYRKNNAATPSKPQVASLVTTNTPSVPQKPSVTVTVSTEQEASEGAISAFIHKIAKYLTWGNFIVFVVVVAVIFIILRYVIAYKLLMKYL